MPTQRFFVLAALTMAGCACVCDIDGAIRTRSGQDAVDCGLVPLGQDTTAAIECAQAAIAAGHGVRVGWHRRGRDSEVRTYLAGHDGSFSLLGYDSDPSGGSGQCPTLTASMCTSAPTRMTDASGTVVLTCTTMTTATVCSN